MQEEGSKFLLVEIYCLSSIALREFNEKNMFNEKHRLFVYL